MNTIDILVSISLIFLAIGVLYFRYRSVKRSKMKGNNWIDDQSDLESM